MKMTVQRTKKGNAKIIVNGMVKCVFINVTRRIKTNAKMP